jgi:hypothetical protein
MRHQNGTLVTHNLSAGNFQRQGTDPVHIRIVAKETVLVLSGFYVLFYRRQANYLLKATILCAATPGTYFAVRVFVLHGSMQYHQISNVSLGHVSENLLPDKWVLHTLITLCSYLPFLILAWKDTPLSLKRLILYLLPVLFLSSLFFGWLNETAITCRESF